MKIDVSDKQSGGFLKPHIRKGYYPAKVTSIEPRKDQEGNLFVGQYGNQLIVKFLVYKGDEKGNPIEPIKFKGNIGDGPEVESDVELAKFVYYTYKDRKTGELQTAVTPNSAITKMFKALGWEFDPGKELNTEEFIGKWAEVNIDDYEYEEEGKYKKASSIKDINKFEGKGLGEAEKSPNSSSSKLTSDVDDELGVEELDLSEDSGISEELKKKLEVLKEQVEAGIITEEGFEDIKKKMIASELAK